MESTGRTGVGFIIKGWGFFRTTIIPWLLLISFQTKTPSNMRAQSISSIRNQDATNKRLCILHCSIKHLISFNSSDIKKQMNVLWKTRSWELEKICSLFLKFCQFSRFPFENHFNFLQTGLPTVLWHKYNLYIKWKASLIWNQGLSGY